MIRKGDRVEHIKNHKVGTAAADQYQGGNGPAVEVFWDNSKIKTAYPCNLRNIRKADAE